MYYTQGMVGEKQTQAFPGISQETDNVDRKIAELISKQIDKGITATKARMAKLQSNWMIEQVRPDKGGYWRIIEK